MKTFSDHDSLLTRGVVDLIGGDELQKALESGKKLCVKYGVDPTGSSIHIGHMVGFRKLAEFQKAGHEVVFLVGTFTGKIGDPTGKDAARKPLSDEQIAHNIQSYLSQLDKVLDVSRLRVVYNGDWFSKMTFSEVVALSSHFTVQQMIQRDMFQNRLEKGLPISLHEFLYPLMQGYDSVMLDCDIEIGGTDQLFNLLAGRTLQEAYGQRKQAVMTVPLLEGLDGHEKMSKSLGNYIGVQDTPQDMFGKTMSIPDSLILKYFLLTTSVSTDEIEHIAQQLKEGMNPRDAKMRLGRELVTQYHSAEAAQQAQDEFVAVFANKEKPSHIDTYTLTQDEIGILTLLVQVWFAPSTSEARRLIDGGGVRLDDERVSDASLILRVTTQPILLQVGKRKFVFVVRS